MHKKLVPLGLLYGGGVSRFWSLIQEMCVECMHSDHMTNAQPHQLMMILVHLATTTAAIISLAPHYFNSKVSIVVLHYEE